MNLIFNIVKLYTQNSFFTNGPDLLTTESKLKDKEGLKKI